MKKICLLFIGVLFFTSFAVAQVSSNPNDSFYGNVYLWEIQGLVENVPQVRPYPLHIVEKILNEVIESETPVESEKAQKEYERIFKRPYHLTTSENATYIKKENSRMLFDADAHIQGDWKFQDFAGVSYYMGLLGLNGWENEKLPRYKNIAHDCVADSVSYGKLNTFFEINTNVFFGNEKFFGTAGINRLGFGPFWQEGVALNDTAYHFSALSYTVQVIPDVTFSQVFTSLGASDNFGRGIFSAKYLALHSVKWNVSSKLGLSYYENIVFGRRTEISYFLPVPYMTNQNINGCNDNLQMGLIAEYRPLPGLKFAADFFADDMSLRFKGFDDRFHFASILGASYSPSGSKFRLVDLNYTVVMPYVYSHWEFDDPNDWTFSGSTVNYQNYTNNSRPMGSTLPPDSDKVRLKVKVEPVQNLSMDFTFGVMRHQNVCEIYSEGEGLTLLLSDSDKALTDGSIFNHQFFRDYGITQSADHELAFMKGEHTMWDFQTGIDVSYTIPTSKTGSFKIGLGYDFEFIKNAGVDRNLYPGQSFWGYDGNYYVTLVEEEDGSYTWNGVKYENGSKVIEKAKADWVAGFKDLFNHFLTVKFTWLW